MTSPNIRQAPGMKKFLKRVFRFIFKTVLYLAGFALALTVLYKFVTPPITPIMVLRYFENPDAGIHKQTVSYEEVAPVVYRSILAAEDARFFSHGGVDWRAVENAREYNRIHKGKKVRGASTVTMQTAKNVFLTHHRTRVRKGLEVGFTYLIEWIWGKRRILEVYVNIVEWGEGIYGIEEAARHYFGKSAADLTATEAARLAAVLPNPRRWSPAKPTNYILKRTRTIRARAKSIGLKGAEK